MNIIQKQPNPSGAYGQVFHSFDGLDPNMYYEVIADMANFYTWNGFIIPTIEDGKVTSYVCNTEAWGAWKAWKVANPEPAAQPTIEDNIIDMLVDYEYRLTLLEV